MSIDAWVKLKTDLNQGGFIVNKIEPLPGNTGYGFFIKNQGLHFQFGNSLTYSTNPLPFIVGMRHHVAVTLDRTSGTPALKFYLDGTQVANFTSPSAISLTNAVDLFVGQPYASQIADLAIDELEIFNRVLTQQEILDIFNAGPAGKCKGDLGDAPDSTNHAGVTMTTGYTLGNQANFPTVYDPNLAGNAPLGPIHLNAKGLAWLGADVSFEGEADTGWDQELNTLGNNIQPILDIKDRDAFDDGVTNVLLPDCAMTNFSFSATNALTTSTQVYINVWFDWTLDGDWDDMPRCAVNPVTTALAPEWAVQNHVVTLNPGSNAGLVTPPFRSINPPPGQPVWMRITLTDVLINGANHGGPFQPGDGKGGSGPVGGYQFGETEDYLWRVESGIAEICVTKFEDQNGNGVQDPGEPGLAGWQIEVTDVSGNPIPGSPFITDAAGTVCFGVPAPGTYTITEQVQTGWTPTTPNPQTVNVSPSQTVYLSFGNTECVQRPPDMVAWWPLDELPGDSTVVDLAGTPNNGTPMLGSSPTTIGTGPTSVPGQYVANSLQFGISRYVEVQNDPELNFGQGAFTIDAWVRFTPGTQTEPIVYKLDQSGGYFLYITYPSQGPAGLELQIGGTGGPIFLGPAIGVIPGTWIFVAATRQVVGGTSTVTLYVGVPNNPPLIALTSPTTTSIPDASSSAPLWIGYWIGNPHANLAIDELEIFDRALDATEINTIFQADTKGKCKGRGWKLYLPLVLK